ncbi:Hypothetical predicted protein, partial [Olea europaea subsp. europaea]
ARSQHPARGRGRACWLRRNLQSRRDRRVSISVAPLVEPGGELKLEGRRRRSEGEDEATAAGF